MKCKHCDKDCGSGKFCSNCGKEIEKEIEKETETATPMPVVEKTVEEKFEEYLQTFEKRILISAKMLKSENNLAPIISDIFAKYGMNKLPEEFKQFMPIFINATLQDDCVIICSLNDLLPKKYHKIFDKSAIFKYYNDDKCTVGENICLSKSLIKKDDNFDCGLFDTFNKKFKQLLKIGQNENEIIEHLETIQPSFTNLLR